MMKDNELFLQYVSNNYDYLKKKMRAWAFNTKRQYSEDIFQDTILKIYELLTKNGKANDNSDYGFECLFFRAFSINSIRETQYAYNKYKDSNIESTELMELYEDYKNLFELTEDEKVLLDMYKDYAVKYILEKVEENFSDIDYRLFSIKLYYKCTYKRLKEMTKIKDVKTRVMRINEWIKTNITKNEIQKSFDEYVENIT